MNMVMKNSRITALRPTNSGRVSANAAPPVTISVSGTATPTRAIVIT